MGVRAGQPNDLIVQGDSPGQAFVLPGPKLALPENLGAFFAPPVDTVDEALAVH